MDAHVLLVFSDPVPGREDEYNDWYTNVHLGEVIATDGFVAAQRFVLANSEVSAEIPYRYMAIYEVEGDLEQARAALAAGRETRTPTSDAMAPDRRSVWYTAISDRRTPGGP